MLPSQPSWTPAMSPHPIREQAPGMAAMDLLSPQAISPSMPTWAVGIEGDIAWGDSKSIAAIPGACSRIGCGDIAGVQEGWDGSIRGRFGFLLTPAWLLYATGGIAWQGLG